VRDIPNFDTFVKVEPIHKGWSGDKKYYVETKDGERLLLRVSDISTYDAKKYEFDVMKKMSATGMKMSKPVSFGVCENGKSVYQLLSWCDGEEAKEALYNLSEAEQYAFGQKTASILKLMETIDAQPASMEWANSFQERVEHYIELYHNCGYTFPGDELIISYLQTGHHCIGERPTALMHMDFQTDNMVISPNGELYTIDFQMCGVADPYHVLTGAGVSAMYSVPFAMGQIEGYFGKTIPDDFWEVYAYYMTAEMLYAFTVGVHMEEEREETLHMFDDEVERIKQGGSPVPSWYKEGVNAMEQTNIANSVYQAALEYGFDNCGIIPIAAMDSFEANYRKRIEAVPTAASFYSYTSAKEKFPWAKSIVICTYDFSRYRYPEELRGRYGKAFLLGPEKGKPYGYDAQGFMRWMTENGIRCQQGGFGSMRHAAEQAGLGVVRKNNFFYTEKGSYVELIGFVIDSECQLIHKHNLTPCSDKCDLCQKACKTKSLSAPHTMDPFKCVSFWTTFGKGNVPPGLTEDMYEQWLCGCDNCQDACPYNHRHNWDEGEPFSDLEEIAPMLTPEKILEATDDFLREQIISRTADHLQPEDTEVLRRNAGRAKHYEITG